MKTNLKLASALLAIGATTASLGLITPAHAQEVSVIHISTANIDLSSPGGQRILNLRIARAAEALCYDANARFDIRVRKAGTACRDEAIRSARAVVSERTMTQIALAKTSR